MKNQTITYKLKRKSETNEWKVAAFVDGKYNEAMTYYTDDKQDAVGTLAAMEKSEQERQDREAKHITKVLSQASSKRLTLNLLNGVLETLGVKEKLVRGNGYFYFVGGDAMRWHGSSVYVNRLSTLTLAQWINERSRLARNSW